MRGSVDPLTSQVWLGNLLHSMHTGLPRTLHAAGVWCCIVALDVLSMLVHISCTLCVCVLRVAWHFVCTGLIGHYLILMIGVTGHLALCVYGADRTLLYTYDWCHGSPGTLCVRG